MFDSSDRRHEEKDSSASHTDGAGHDAGGADQGAAHRAAALVNDREPPTPREMWQQQLGRLFGGKLYDLIVPHADADQFLSMGKKALDDALRSVAKDLGRSVRDQGPLVEGLVVDEVKRQLQPLATKFMQGPGKALAELLADSIEEHPVTVLCAMILAAAGAVLMDVPLPDLPVKFHLGKDWTVAMMAKLGSVRNISAERIAIEIGYTSGAISSKVKFERIDGADQQKVTDQLYAGTRGTGAPGTFTPGAGNINGDMPIRAGAISSDSPLFHVRSDVLYKFHSMSATTASFGNESWIQNGQFLSGKVNLNLKTDLSPRTHLDVGVQQSYGANKYGLASANATYAPNKQTSLSIGLSQSFGPGGPGFGADVSFELKDRVAFKGHVQENGAWVGVVFRLP